MYDESIDSIRNQIVDLIQSLDIFTTEELIQLANDVPGDCFIKRKIIEDLLYNFPLADLNIYYEYFLVKH